MKKTIISVLAIIIIGGGAFAAKSAIIDKPSDPQTFVNQALANYFGIDSAAVESVINMSVSRLGLANVAGSLNLRFTGKANNLQEYLPEIDYQIIINGEGGEMGSEATVAFAGDLRILDEIFYGKLGKVELTGTSNEITAAVGAASAFVEKWFAISFAKLKAADPEIEKLFEKQKIQQLTFRSELKNLLATNDVFLVESLPLSFGKNQKFKVGLNSEFLASDRFFAILEKMLIPQLPEETENPFEFDEAIKSSAKKVLAAVAKNSNGILEIGKKDGLIRRGAVVLNLDLVDLALESLPTGQISISADTRISEIDKLQKVVAPTEFEEIDPFDFIPAPTEAETKLEAEGNLE